MCDRVKVVKDAMIPFSHNVHTESLCTNGLWLMFKYSDSDKDPWKWPKVITYKNKYFQWMSYNSDGYYINYKEISKDELAMPFKK